MFTLNLIVFICFINVFGYILSLYLISKYDIETKFPKLKGIIKYYEKSTNFCFNIRSINRIHFLNCYFYFEFSIMWCNYFKVVILLIILI
jgi:uncharacterized protein Usg